MSALLEVSGVSVTVDGFQATNNLSVSIGPAGLRAILSAFLDRRGGDLSGGQRQQLAVARALITKPRLVLLEEPAEGIQPHIIQQIGRVIDLLRAPGDMAILLVEQYFDFAWKLADRTVVLMRGAVIFSGEKSSTTRAEMLAKVSV